NAFLLLTAFVTSSSVRIGFRSMLRLDTTNSVSNCTCCVSLSPTASKFLLLLSLSPPPLTLGNCRGRLFPLSISLPASANSFIASVLRLGSVGITHSGNPPSANSYNPLFLTNPPLANLRPPVGPQPRVPYGKSLRQFLLLKNASN